MLPRDEMAANIANELSRARIAPRKQRIHYHEHIPTVFLGLGSNIDAEGNLRRCAAMLRESFDDVAFSPVYKTAPRDQEDQPDFLNAVARVETNLTLEKVFARTNSIEEHLGKRLPYPKGPRTIDIDILLYGNLVSDDSALTLPHPRLHERRFVLEPLCELLTTDETHPLLKISWRELLRKNLDQVVAVTEIRL